MTKQQQEVVFDNIVAEMRKIMLGKGDDYDNEDRLSNCRLDENILVVKHEQNWFNIIETKLWGKILGIRSGLEKRSEDLQGYMGNVFGLKKPDREQSPPGRA